MNILIPMAGAGSRFARAGYTDPKPLIPINGIPMIEVVVKNLNIQGNYIFLVQKEHNHKYGLEDYLNKVVPGCTVLTVDGVTEGAACTTLLAKDYINKEEPLIISNSDQFVEWDANACLEKFNNYNGGIVIFTASDTKWSYAQVDENGLVNNVAEKKVISNLATVGIYYYKNGSDYVRYAERMIEKNIRVNNEFYVCPVFNEAFSEGFPTTTYAVNGMWGLGTPEDLKHFLSNYAFNSPPWTS